MINRVSHVGQTLARQNKVVVAIAAVVWASVVSVLALNLFQLVFGAEWQIASLDNLRLELLLFAIFNALMLKFQSLKKAPFALMVIGSLWVFFLQMRYGFGPLAILRDICVAVCWPLLNLFVLDSFVASVNRRRSAQ
ncbi:MAG: hypothetical protein JSS72_12495 [Armatimonadetes bacterium]|nr:hypothetical protein [Armatimonadota bacterium]